MLTALAVALPQKKRVLRGRCLVAVDIENVAKGAIVSRFVAESSRSRIRSVVPARCGDHVIVGTSHIGLLNAGLAWSGARMVVGSGPDGADLALLGVLAGEGIATRFDEVVLVSGDGIFEEAVAELGRRGVRVTVVADQECCSRRLRLAAANVVWLPAEMPEEAVAA